MGVRLKGEYYSTSGELWTWQLIDTDFGDLQHDTQLTSEGLQFRWDGDAKNKDSRFITCTCSFSLQVNHNNIEDFRDAIRNAAEGRFFLRAGTNGGVTYIGRVTVDDGQWEDNARPYPFRLIATDGIGALKDRNYSSTVLSVEAPYEDQPTLLQHVLNCLDKTGIKDHYTGQDYLWVICDTYEDQHPNSTDNPLAVTRVDAKAFYNTVQETGVYNYKDCGEVLRNILVNFRSTLMYVGPHYLIQQRNARASSSFRVFKYSTAGTLIGSATVSDEITVSNAGAVNYRKGISSFGFLPGMLKSTVKYNHGEQDVNMLLGISYEGDNIPTPGTLPPMVQVGSVDVNGLEDIVLRFSGKLRIKSTYDAIAPSPRWRNHRYHFRIFLNTVAPAYDLWWKMEYLPFDFYTTSYSNFGHAQFENAGPWSFDVVTDIINEMNRDLNIYSLVGFDTSPLVHSEINEIYFSFQFVAVYDENMNPIGAGAVNPVICEWDFSDLELVALEDGTILKRPTASISEVTGNVLNSYSLEEEVIIGDGPGKSSIGRLQVYTGSEWKDSFLWSAAGETSRKLHLIAAQEALAAQQTSLLVMQGGYYATTNVATAMSRISYVGKYFLLLSGTYDTPNDLWEGEWVEIITPSRTGLTWAGKTEVSKERLPLPISNKLPLDEQKQDRVIKFPFLTKDGIDAGTAITTINLGTTATTNLFYEGDVIYLVDPVHGHAEKVTVASDVQPGHTSVSIESFTPEENYPPGSYLEPDPAFEANNTYSETNEVYHLENNFSGTSFVCSHDLTDITLESDQAVISKRHKVYKNGQKLIYGHAMGWSINNGTNSVVLAETCYGDYIEVYSYKTRKVSYVAVSSLSSGSGSGSGTLSP